MQYFIIIILSYLLGSIPFAYLVVRVYGGVDIRERGTGNLGAMNSYDTTGKKGIGILVFFLDALKGLVAVLLARMLTNHDFLAVSAALVFTVIGHNYSIFMMFRGGRGLATAVGGLLAINYMAIILWGLMWIIGYFFIKKNVHVGNIFASISTPIIIYLLPPDILLLFMITSASNIFYFKILCSVVCLLFILRHIDPLKKMIVNKDI